MKKVIAEHRAILKERVNSLQWSKELPQGYTISKDGTVHKNDFKSLTWN